MPSPLVVSLLLAAAGARAPKRAAGAAAAEDDDVGLGFRIHLEALAAYCASCGGDAPEDDEALEAWATAPAVFVIGRMWSARDLGVWLVEVRADEALSAENASAVASVLGDPHWREKV